MTLDVQVEAFRRVALPWINSIRSQGIVALAIRSADGWIARHVVHAFSPVSAKENSAFVANLDLETESIRAYRTVVPATEDDFLKLLERFGRPPRVWKIAGHEFQLGASDRGLPSYHYSPFRPHRAPGTACQPTLAMFPDHGMSQTFPRPELLDLELMAASTPFAGLNELAVEIGARADLSERGGFELTIGPPVRFTPETSLVSERLYVAVGCTTEVDSSEITLSARVFRRDGPVERRRLLSPTAWSSSDKYNRIGRTEAVVDGSTIAQLYLSHRGQFVEHLWVRDPSSSLNPMLDLLKTFDSKDVMGSRFLEERESAFEDQVALLLTLNGFQALHLGNVPSLRDAPDILCLSPSGQLLLVECTTSDIDPPRLRRLADRRERVASTIVKGGLPVQPPLALVVTRLTRNDTQAIWPDAKRFGISIFGIEQVEQLRATSEGPPRPTQIFDEIKQFVPEGPGPEQPSFL